jgi:hypothetical protein
MLKTLLLLWVSISLASCTIVGHKPTPQGWPELVEQIERPGFWQAQQICGAPIPFGIAVACAQPDLVKGICRIILTSDDPEVLEHEREHCRGKDHIGSTALADYYKEYAAWKARYDAEQEYLRGKQ